MSLGEGLTGRSENPVELLFDTLFHPNADIDFGQESRFDWRSRPDLAIPHLVVGDGEPGGSWQAMHNSMVTLSYGDWMELPGYSLSAALRESGISDIDTSSDRVQRSLVARYYQDYPNKTGIARHMVNHSRVTSVMTTQEASVQGLCGCGLMGFLRRFPFLGLLLPPACRECAKYKWLARVERRDAETGKVADVLYVLTNTIVLATGMFDVPKKVGFPGEDFPFVVHSVQALDALERKITESSISSQPELDLESPWVVVVGSGLSAADAVLHLRSQGRNVIHLFQDQKGSSPLSRYSRSAYPEYASLYRLMKGGARDVDPVSTSAYEPLGDAEILGVTRQGHFTVRTSKGAIFRHKISRILVLIGSEPFLAFMGPNLPKDATDNLNPNTCAVEGNKGLYMVGSLTGSKFVRFGLGTTLAVARDITRERVASLSQDHSVKRL